MTERIIRLLARHLPGYAVRTVERLGEGQDNAAYEVNGELVIRQSKIGDSVLHGDSVFHGDAAFREDLALQEDPALHGDPALRGDSARPGDTALRAEAVRREAALLAAVSELSPLPVPQLIFVDEEAGVLAYRKLPGRPLNLHPVREPARLAGPLSDFLSRLHAAPVERMEAFVPRDTYPMSELLEEAEGHYRDIVAHVPPTARRMVEDFLGTAAPAGPGVLTFCHNDLGSEHLLVDVEASAVTGVIDWTDAAIADPAYDLALVYRDLGPEVYGGTLAHYQGRHDDADHERVLFYARCALLEDVAYGLCSGVRSYADAGLAHLGRTFSEHP
ncbi:phosphotransferase [Microbispora sp. NBRC 16548]|uniref:phosphotransferase family protein n=1 Tax=Microbispora sp. NBRC 16548 TaxID=3030994 RepID=UPI0025538B51|nr:phosphotransferase [Microbispora sp. NBRC 16548]